MVLGLCLVSSGAFAENRAPQSFTLTDNVTGYAYQCGPGSGGSDVNCVTNLASTCNNYTRYGSNYCYDQAVNLCRGARAGYASCVDQTTNYCTTHTNRGSIWCYNNSVESCRGAAEQIQNLMKQVEEKAVAPKN